MNTPGRETMALSLPEFRINPDPSFAAHIKQLFDPEAISLSPSGRRIGLVRPGIADPSLRIRARAAEGPLLVRIPRGGTNEGRAEVPR
ncbi:hypothetical protein [Nonomuraea sp. NPDC049400]|uniref:hypothetical protein n=1 Tax=Nonomuraea sp. NPDC049400 TaxID=3364352 RepID=UPI003787C21D